MYFEPFRFTGPRAVKRFGRSNRFSPRPCRQIPLLCVSYGVTTSRLPGKSPVGSPGRSSVDLSLAAEQLLQPPPQLTQPPVQLHPLRHQCRHLGKVSPSLGFANRGPPPAL